MKGGIPEASQVAEAIEIVRKGRKEVTWYKEKADEYNKALDKLISLARLYLEVVKEVPSAEELLMGNECKEGDKCPDGEENGCDRCSIYARNLEIVNSARSQFIPLLMAEKAKNEELKELYDGLIKNHKNLVEIVDPLSKQLASAQEEIKHWKANHADMVSRCALLRERPDLPVDRIPAYKELVQAQEKIEKLEMERDYEQDKKLEAQERIRELEAIAERVRDVEGIENIINERCQGVVNKDKVMIIYSNLAESISKWLSEG